MFLVLLRCNFDDLPLKLCATHTSAVAFADEVTREQAKSAAAFFGVNLTDINCIDIVQFGADGLPANRTTARFLDADLDGEPAEPLAAQLRA